jgi:hypothetical protein
VQVGQKVPFVLACFQVSAAPRRENPESDEKDALFSLDTQITISAKYVELVYHFLTLTNIKKISAN